MTLITGVVEIFNEMSWVQMHPCTSHNHKNPCNHDLVLRVSQIYLGNPPVQPFFCDTLQGDGSDDDVEDLAGLQAAFNWRPDPAEMGMIDRFLPNMSTTLQAVKRACSPMLL